MKTSSDLVDKSYNASDFNNCAMKSLIMAPAAWPVSYQDEEKGFIQFSSQVKIVDKKKVFF